MYKICIVHGTRASWKWWTCHVSCCENFALINLLSELLCALCIFMYFMMCAQRLRTRLIYIYEPHTCVETYFRERATKHITHNINIFVYMYVYAALVWLITNFTSLSLWNIVSLARCGWCRWRFCEYISSHVSYMCTENVLFKYIFSANGCFIWWW